MTEDENRKTGMSDTLLPSEGSSRQEFDELRRVIRRGNLRWKSLVLLETLGLAVAAPLLYLWMMVGLDSVLHLSVPGRVAASLVFLAAVAWQARRLLASWRQARFSDDEVALAMERNTPGGLENRLINSIQLAAIASAVPDEARQAVLRENALRLRSLHVEQAARIFPALIRIGLAMAAIIAGIGFQRLQPDRFYTSAARILMPFSDVEPLYRTTLKVNPGDIRVEPGSDVRLSVVIEGRLPDHLLIMTRSGGDRRSVEVPVSAETNRVEHLFRNLRRPLSYAVRGGDYVSPFYLVDVPEFPELQQLRVVYSYPRYTGLPDRVQEGTSGDIQAVFGTEARLRFTLTQPVQSAALVMTPLRAAGDDAAEPPEAQRLELQRESTTEFSANLRIERSLRYHLETVQRQEAPSMISRTYEILALEDQPPDLQLTGLVGGQELTLDAVAALTVVGRDDFGLLEVGVFSRLRVGGDAQWEELQAWPVSPPSRQFDREWVLAVASLGAAEGDVMEVAVRGRDNNPLREGQWHTGQPYSLVIGAEGARLQLEYERILQAEANLNRLIRQVLEVSETLGEWVVELNAGGNVRWDDGKNLARLADGMTELATLQAEIRALAVSTAREMPAAAGSLHLSVGMLADSEMIRAIQMIESVAGRDSPVQMRSVLGEARLTQERTLRSLRDILSAYMQFRRDWELEYMMPFLEMLAVRQLRMSVESLGYGDLPSSSTGERLRTGTSRRQRRLRELTGLARVAFADMSGRDDVLEDTLLEAFAGAAEELSESTLLKSMEQAESRLESGHWSRAAEHQEQAGNALVAVHARLREVQEEVARRMMEELKLLTDEQLEQQGDIKALNPGYSEQLMQGDLSVMAEIVKMSQLAEAMKEKRFDNAPDGPPQAEGVLADYINTHSGSGYKMSTEERDFSIMTLASRPSGQLEAIPGFETSDRMEISLIQEYQDVVGALLDEADDLREEYQSMVNMLQGQDIEGGDISKGGHGMASVSAAAPTGNMKPDTHEHGGASRVGRQGARAHGVAVGEESISRRGRDEAQEGSEETPDVAGAIKETLSDDPADDHSTGIGGREVDGEKPGSFSTKDAGEWDDSMAERLKPPEAVHQLVERKGSPLSPETADLLRAMDSTQQQVIERVKRIKKDLDNLYLPTDHLDDALLDFAANLDRLRSQPGPEAFRMQMESLDRLMGAVMVFERPDSEYQPSLGRQSSLRGHILDESASPVMPEYEEAVKRYYERLANP